MFRPAVFLPIGMLLLAVAVPTSAAGATTIEESSYEETYAEETSYEETYSEDTQASVLVCRKWDGEPFDYWKVQQLDRETADWLVANSTGTSIVASAADCPANTPVTLCIPYGDTVKVVVAEPWTANSYLAADPSITVSTNGTCSPKVVETEPTPTPSATPTPSPTTTPTTQPTTQPTVRPTVSPQESIDDSSSADDAEVLGVTQTREELADTGAEHAWITVAALVLIAIGGGLILVNRRLSMGS